MVFLAINNLQFTVDLTSMALPDAVLCRQSWWVVALRDVALKKNMDVACLWISGAYWLYPNLKHIKATLETML